jgi:hypothetical protein
VVVRVNEMYIVTEDTIIDKEKARDLILFKAPNVVQ